MSDLIEQEVLKPCPFCGLPASIIPDSSHSTGYEVFCLNKHACEVTPSVWGENKERAIVAWNRRAPTHPSAEAVREACAKVCDEVWEQDVGTSGAGSSATCALRIRALSLDSIAAKERK